MAKRTKKKNYPTYTDNHGMLYWTLVNFIAKRRASTKISKETKEFSLVEYVAKKVFAIKMFLHDGVLVDGHLFRIEDPDFGVPGEPAEFTSPIGIIKHDFSKILGHVKRLKRTI